MQNKPGSPPSAAPSPWWQRKRITIPLGVFAGLMAILALNNAETTSLPAAAATTTTTATPPASPVPMTVASVTDGDTLKLSDGRTVRLAQVDAPETNECFGSESTVWLRQYAGKVVTLQRPTTAPANDRYGRWVSEVLAEGLSLNVETVRLGFAEVYTQFAHEDRGLYDRMTTAAHEAKQAGRGLWSACAGSPAPTATTRSTATSTIQPAPTAAEPYYANCDAARAAGAAPLHRGDPGYRTGLDRDDDGVACEPSRRG